MSDKAIKGLSVLEFVLCGFTLLYLAYFFPQNSNPAARNVCFPLKKPMAFVDE